MSRRWLGGGYGREVVFEGEGDTDGVEEGADGGEGFLGDALAADELQRTGGEGAAEGDAAISAVGAGGEVGDAEGGCGRAEDGAGGCHAVGHAEDFQLGLELVGDEVDDDVGVADGLVYGRGVAEGAGTGGWG